jgi:hypothetical protein
MKLTTGAKWGLVAGLVVGVLAGVLANMSVMSILDALVEYAYQDMVKRGTPPALARQEAEFIRQIASPSAFAGGIAGNVIIYLIMGLVMAAVWERLRLPWYAKGAHFGVVLTVLLSLPSLLLPPAAGHSNVSCGLRLCQHCSEFRGLHTLGVASKQSDRPCLGT